MGKHDKRREQDQVETRAEDLDVPQGQVENVTAGMTKPENVVVATAKITGSSRDAGKAVDEPKQ